MKILHIIPTLGSGGAERFVVDLVNNLVGTNEVYLITLFDLKDPRYSFFLNQVDTRIKIISLNKRIGLQFSIPFKLSKNVKEISPDIVHTHLGAINYIFLTAMTVRSIEFFHTIHNDANKEHNGKLTGFLRHFLFKYKLVVPVTISKESQKSFREYYGLNSDILIYNGRERVDKSNSNMDLVGQFEAFRKTKKTKVLINVASFKQPKNQLNLAKAICNLNTSGFDIVLLLVGKNNTLEGEKIKFEIESLKSPFIYVLGEKENVADYLLLSDAFCLVSTYEGMPISLIEAFSIGRISICTPVGGIIDMIEDGVNGFLAKGTSVSDIEDVIKRYISFDNIILLEENAKKQFDNKYHISISARSYMNLYNQSYVDNEEVRG